MYGLIFYTNINYYSHVEINRPIIYLYGLIFYTNVNYYSHVEINRPIIYLYGLIILNYMSFFLFLSETLKEFNEFVITDSSIKSQLEDLKTRVEKFASSFPMPGLDDR